eukprot:TRINITY_DN106225_c0_g1_i1.p1 TRINITY_DN106225_c0_g1~~TRINITY_DN106225_c0_g1_i1.p1  ORF type:complete len:206 (-),score=21.79 TRINITY_DN106225_c0_g1_i1:218-787(-)
MGLSVKSPSSPSNRRSYLPKLCRSKSLSTEESTASSLRSVCDATISSLPTPSRRGLVSLEASIAVRKTRIFVKTSRALLPTDVDLSWTGLAAAEHVASLLGDLVSQTTAWSLRFRGKDLFTMQTLKECGIELGSVLHVQVRSGIQPQTPVPPRSARPGQAVRERRFIRPGCDDCSPSAKVGSSTLPKIE